LIVPLFLADFNLSVTGFSQSNYRENVNIYQNIGEQKVNDVTMTQQ